MVKSIIMKLLSKKFFVLFFEKIFKNLKPNEKLIRYLSVKQQIIQQGG